MTNGETVGDFLRVFRKFKTDGWDTLSSEERALLDRGGEFLKHRYEEAYKEALATMNTGPPGWDPMQLWERMSPQQRERFEDWDLDQMYAFELLLDLDHESDSPDDASS